MCKMCIVKNDNFTYITVDPYFDDNINKYKCARHIQMQKSN